MKFLPKAAINLAGIAGVLAFLGENKRWWLLPMLLTLIFFAMLILLGQHSAVSPLMYTRF
jgi:hypothetical protein